MKLTDLKHDHSLTNLLKIIIFSILMLTPFFYVATKCLYVVCNKNAYESYSGLNQNTESNIILTDYNNVDYSKNYYIGNSNINNNTNTGSSAVVYFDVLEVIANTTTTTNETILDFERMYFYYSGNAIYYNFYDSENTNTTLNSGQTFLLKVNIRSFSGTTQTLQNFNYVLSNSTSIYTINYFNNDQLDNVFEYSVNQMAQSQLFTWTQNTGIYTGANAMTTGLGLTSPVIPILISYWFLLTIIYVVIDIVIVCFTTITHMIVKKSN